MIYAFEEKFYENYTGNANKTDEDEIEELSAENFEWCRFLSHMKLALQQIP